jgi:uncharacterized damage-inducible protein DinB
MSARMATPDSVAPLARSNVEYLRQGRALIAALDEDEYAGTAPSSPRGGVGAHFRHVLDHYGCLLTGLAGGSVDYDAREREVELEQRREFALERIDATVAALERLPPSAGKRELEVSVDCDEPGRRSASRSSLARELQFLVSHTVHHYAVIALLLRSRGIEPGRDFGVAPSTLRYEQGKLACAR